MKGFGYAVAMIVVLVVLMAVGDAIGPLHALDAFLAEHPALYQRVVVAAIVLIVAGAASVLLGQFVPAARRPSAAADAAAPYMEYEVKRVRLHRSMSFEATASQVKAAWRTRAWRHVLPWRIFFVMFFGAAALLLGLEMLFLAVAPPAVKFVVLLLGLYVVGLVGWSLARAG